ncbi:MAG: HlyD family secretion protein [Rhodospirillales bacterium]|nr:MAG: HlyD family secretion protein [Rhodospirillales bacterium]
MRDTTGGEGIATASTPATAAPRRRLDRRMVARAIMWSLPVAAAVVGLLFWLGAGLFVGTDNAYVKGDRVLIASEVAGVVSEVAVTENQRVAKGTVLLRLDERPYKLALARVEAELENVRAEIRGLRASWRQKREEVKQARSQETYAQSDFDRQAGLAQRGVASTQRLDEARRDLDISRQRIAMLSEEMLRIEAQLGGDPKVHTDDHPRVRQIAAARDEALLNLKRTTIVAPFDGVASRRPTVGASATIGQPLISVIADTGLWIEANFKETDLTRVRPGQPVTVHVDTYPDRVWRGTVASIAPASGAEFAVLPPQNASGNWVKIVQRIPLRVEVRPDPGAPPLRVGMSAQVEIDTGHRRSLGELGAMFGRLFGGGATDSQPAPR